MRFLLSAALCGVVLAAPAKAVLPFDVTYESEAPGIQNSTSTFSFKGVETFEGRSTGTFTSDFGTGGIFTGTYSGVRINDADQYGGADGTGRYAVTFDSAGYSLDLTTSHPGGITYFGFWLSALDRGNTVTFFSGANRLFTFSATDAKGYVDSKPGASAYYCNPNAAFAGENCGEPYMFLNFYAKAGQTFDRVVFAERPEVGGYESDNHTVGQWLTQSGTVLPGAGAVPEPASWALLIAGFGLVGATARRTRRVPVAA